MSAIDETTLRQAFKAHTEGQFKFTRRMAITIADMAGTTPRNIVLRLERLGLLKPGSWEWFLFNGGITQAQIVEVRTDRGKQQISSRSATEIGETPPTRNSQQDNEGERG